MSALDALDDQQREAARALRGPVRVLAGAGTGKTRVITHRIAHGVDVGAYSPGRVMAVTFTAKAAGEMRGRLRALGVGGVSARTFHAAALAQLNYFWPQVTGEPAPSIVNNKVRMIAHAADALGLRPDTATLRDVAAEIEWRKITMRSMTEYAVSGRSAGRLPTETVVRLQQAYEDLKDERHQLDFEDVLLACAGMLEAEPRVTQAVREQYRHFTVDEYQDVSPLQHRLLQLWLGDRRDLCVVGDVSQTVFSFAGADAKFLLDFKREFPDAVSVELTHSYRSVPAVLGVANDLMRGRPGAITLEATREATAVQPTVAAFDDDELEAAGVAATIAKQLQQGAAPSDIAVLYRSQAQSIALTSALAQAGIAAQTLGGRRFFDLPEVRQAVLALRAQAVAPVVGGLVINVRTVMRDLGLTEEPPAAGGATRDQWESRMALMRLAEQAPQDMDLRAFSDDLIARTKDQHDPVLETVTLATMHAAKGLEWKHVHIIGVAEGLLPIGYATSFDAIDEERRLTYVGVTRAQDTLHLSWSRSNGRMQRTPSRFLQEIGSHSLRAASAGAMSGANRGQSRRTV